MPRADNEDDLVQKARARDKAAFTALFKHYKDDVYGFAMVRLSNPDAGNPGPPPRDLGSQAVDPRQLAQHNALKEEGQWYHPNPNDAEDITAETFRRAWQGIGSFRGESSFGTWLNGIAKIVIADKVSRDSRERPRRVSCVADSTFEEAATRRVDLEAMLQVLSDEDKKIVLYRMHGLDYRTIAEELGIEPTKKETDRLKKRFERALEKLRQNAKET